MDRGKSPYDLEENIVVFQNPDGTIQLGTQPHYKNKRVVQCWSCKQQMICSLNYDFAKCYHCQKLNNLSTLKNPQPSPADQAGRLISCSNCGERIRIPQTAPNTVVHCPSCHHVTSV